jgi:hypothetical protein
VKIVPWQDEEVDLRRRAAGRYWFTVRRNLWTAVMLELELSDEDAAALREEVQRVTGRKVGLEK